MNRPSSLPMLAQCTRFAGMPSEHTESGTARHKALYGLLTGTNANAVKLLPTDECEAVEWAADYVRAHAYSGCPMECEVTREWLRPDFSAAKGTPDITCGHDLFDFKWRVRDYRPQMADYALWIIQQGNPTVNVHVMFGEPRKVQTYTFDRESAEDEVMSVLSRVGTEEAKAGDYCGWCKDAFRCPAHLTHVEPVAKGYTADPRVQSWHPSKMESGEDLAYALWLWRTVLSKWGESVEFHAREAAIKGGITLSCKVAEYELKTRKGRTYCTSVPGAFPLAGVPQEEFLKCCDLRITTSKKYPDKIGLANLYAGQNGMKLAPAKRELLAKLESVIKQTPETISLAEKKDSGSSTESEE